MGLVQKKNDLFELSENINNFFSIPIINEDNIDVEKLKEKVYKLNIDNEKKSSLINRINKAKSNIELEKISKEIEWFLLHL